MKVNEETESFFAGGVLETYVKASVAAKAARDESKIRALLERWVSGLEPSVALDRNGQVIGLCDAASEVGTRPFIFGLHDG